MLTIHMLKIHVKPVSSFMVFICSDCSYQSADVFLTVPFDLRDLLLVLLVLHPQVPSLHLVSLDHVAESLVSLLFSSLQLCYLLQEFNSLLVKETTCVLLGFKSQCCAYLKK